MAWTTAVVRDGLQIVRGCGKQGDRLTDVPPDSGYTDFEPSSEAGERIAIAQMSQREQRLTAGTEAAPARSPLPAVAADQIGEVVQRSGGQRDGAG